MKTVVLCRTDTGDQGTFGLLIADGFSCFTGELPWRDNLVGASCIPAGRYKVKIRHSPKYGSIYWVTDVAGRSWILAHWGNYCGDREKGYLTHVQGCILLGKSRGAMRGQKAVLNSRLTVKNFMREMDYQPFELVVVDPFVSEFPEVA